jgi:hypothetical protein
VSETTNGIVNIIDEYLIKEHNRIAKEFFDAGKDAAKKEIIKLLENAKTYYKDNNFLAVGMINWAISLIQNIDNSNVHTTVDNEINGTSKSVLRRMAIQHPPESFRDKANGE